MVTIFYYGYRRNECGELFCSLGNKGLAALTRYIAREFYFIAGYLALISDLELLSGIIQIFDKGNVIAVDCTFRNGRLGLRRISDF